LDHKSKFYASPHHYSLKAFLPLEDEHGEKVGGGAPRFGKFQ